MSFLTACVQRLKFMSLTLMLFGGLVVGCNGSSGTKAAPGPVANETKTANDQKSKDDPAKGDESKSDGSEADTESTDADDSPDSSAAGNTDGNEAGSSDPGIAESLVGTWEGSCEKSPNGVESRSRSLNFTDTSFASSMRYFGDANCSTVIYESKIVTTYRVGGASSKVSGAYDFDSTFSKSSTKIYAQPVLDSINKSLQEAPNAECKALVYKLNVELDDSVCGGPFVDYTLVQVTGSTLKFGACDSNGACTSASARATAVSATAFTKKN